MTVGTATSKKSRPKAKASRGCKTPGNPSDEGSEDFLALLLLAQWCGITQRIEELTSATAQFTRSWDTYVQHFGTQPEHDPSPAPTFLCLANLARDLATSIQTKPGD